MALKITQPVLIKAIAGGFKIVDGSKRDLCYVYVEENQANPLARGLLSPPDGKALAQRLARILDDEAKAEESQPC